jgi:hypothetical protein
VALQCMLKSSIIILPMLFFLLRIALAIWGLLSCHMNCRIDFNFHLFLGLFIFTLFVQWLCDNSSVLFSFHVFEYFQ